MKVSLICPIYNERDSVEDLIKSMLNQSKRPDEILFVDSFSKDGTDEVIKRYSGKNKKIKLIQKKSNIARARNIAVENSKNDIIACTDASCVLDKDWLKNITQPLKDKSIDVVSGGYVAVSKGGTEDYISMITVKPMKEWDEETFLPSGRSIAFRKKAWEATGGYPENIPIGEDTLFDLKLKERGFRFKLAKNAIVHWRGRSSLRKFIKQFYLYGKGDGESGIFKRLKKNLIAFFGMDIFIVTVVVLFFFYPFVSWILLALFVISFLLMGFYYLIKQKRAGCLFWIPILMFLKRMSYFIGVWKGLVK